MKGAKPYARFSDGNIWVWVLVNAACRRGRLEELDEAVEIPEEWANLPLGRFTEYLESMPRKLIMQLVEEDPIAHFKKKCEGD